MTVPTVPQSPASQPAYVPLAPPARPAKFSGLATASLVLGIVGVVFSAVPILDVLTMLGAIVGVVLGAVALSGSSKARAGIGAGLCVLAVVFTALVMNSFTTAVDKAITTPNVAGLPPVPAAPPAPPAAPAGPATSFGEGTLVIGTDIAAGTYKTSGATGSFPCYWARLKDTSGDFGSIIANGNPSGPTTVTISRSDGAFQTSGCNTWTKVR